MYPCSPLCKFNIQLIKLLSNRAPAPRYTANPLPETLAEAVKSKIPSASPKAT